VKCKGGFTEKEGFWMGVELEGVEQKEHKEILEFIERATMI
jgi:hypothetical protein